MNTREKSLRKNPKLTVSSIKEYAYKAYRKVGNRDTCPGEGTQKSSLDLEQAKSLFSSVNKRIQETKVFADNTKADLKELASTSFSLSSQLEENRLSNSRMSSRKKLLEELENAYEGYAAEYVF